MKKLLFLLFLLSSIVSGNILVADEGWRPGPDSKWHIRLETALEQAQRENKFVYVLNTGSDWCGVCKVLVREVLSQKVFADFARKHMVLVYLDRPSPQVPMPQEQRDYNQRTCRKLGLGAMVPVAMLLNSDGKKVGSITGRAFEAFYIAELYQKLDLPGCPVFPAVAKLNLKNRKGKSAKVSVTIRKWGTSENEINKPFNALDTIYVAPGKKVFFEVVYSLPSNFKALLHLEDSEGNKLHSLRGRVTRRGTYIFSAIAPMRDGYWGSRTSSFRATVEPLSKGYGNGFAHIPCSVAIKPDLLENGERVRFAEKVNELRDKFAGSKFEIISWGTTWKCENLYVAGQDIKVSRNKKVYLYLKLQYKLPGKAAIAVTSCKYGLSMAGYKALPASRTYIAKVPVRGRGVSKLYVSLRPNRGEVLKNLITIPCNIVVE